MPCCVSSISALCWASSRSPMSSTRVKYQARALDADIRGLAREIDDGARRDRRAPRRVEPAQPARADRAARPETSEARPGRGRPARHHRHGVGQRFRSRPPASRLSPLRPGRRRLRRNPAPCRPAAPEGFDRERAQKAEDRPDQGLASRPVRAPVTVSTGPIGRPTVAPTAISDPGVARAERASRARAATASGLPASPLRLPSPYRGAARHARLCRHRAGLGRDLRHLLDGPSPRRLDRNGRLLATDIKGATLYADPANRVIDRTS